MSFETQKRKLTTYRRINDEKEIRRDRQETKNSVVNSDIKQYQINPLLLKKFRSWSTDWVVLDQELLTGFPQIDEQYKTWKIEIPEFDIRLLPYLYVDVLYRNLDASLDDGLTQSAYYKNVYFEIADIEGSNYMKSVNLIVNFYISNDSLESFYEAKAIVNFINPRRFD